MHRFVASTLVVLASVGLTTWTVLAGTGAAGTTAEGNDHRPIWMPDGRSIVFMSDRADGDWELYRIGLDGRGLSRLTHHAGWDGYADVSPDGRWLIFDRNDETNGKRIIKLDVTTNVETTLVTFAGEGGGGRWSPDGRHVGFWMEADGSRDIYIVDADGSGMRRITKTPEHEHGVLFSPTGDRLLMVVGLTDGTAIDIMQFDGSQRQRVLTTKGRMYGLSWSPDGRQIAFNADDSGDQNIYVMKVDGTGRRALTHFAAPAHLPVWSRDGRRLIFTHEEGDRERIMILDVATGKAEVFQTGVPAPERGAPPQ